MDIVVSEKQCKNTKKLLTLLSNHLSSRDECRNCRYRLVIQNDIIDTQTSISFKVINDASSEIEFEPYVYPSIHNKKPTDSIPITLHIMLDHFSDLTECNLAYGCLYVNHNIFVPGIYVFDYSLSKNRRYWRRIR